jgi:hypothetical protein
MTLTGVSRRKLGESLLHGVGSARCFIFVPYYVIVVGLRFKWYFGLFLTAVHVTLLRKDTQQSVSGHNRARCILFNRYLTSAIIVIVSWYRLPIVTVQRN